MVKFSFLFLKLSSDLIATITAAVAAAGGGKELATMITIEVPTKTVVTRIPNKKFFIFLGLFI